MEKLITLNEIILFAVFCGVLWVIYEIANNDVLKSIVSLLKK